MISHRLQHAADLLTAAATGLRRAHTPDGNGDWNGKQEVYTIYKDMIMSSHLLRGMANNYISTAEGLKKC